MKTLSRFVLAVLALAAPVFASASVSFTSPANGSTVTSPVHYVATGSTGCSRGVASMGVYVDNKLIFVQKGSKLNAYLTVAPGYHGTVAEEWDNCGHASYVKKSITVKSAAAPGTVQITAPANGSADLTSPVTVTATAQAVSSCSGGVKYFEVFANTQHLFTQTGSSLNTQLALADGAEHIAVKEHDYCGGTAISSVDVTVSSINPPPPPPPPSDAPTVTLTASPASISAGGSSVLTVTDTNTNSVAVSGSDGSSYVVDAGGGSQTVSPATTTTYTVTATGDSGTATASTTVTVASSSPIPPNAISSGNLTGSSRWAWNHDKGTSGTSTGTSVYPVTGLGLDNAARSFTASYSQHGGEIYHLSFGHDTSVSHFIYDVHVRLVDPSQVANVEMDMNQVMADGRTVILATQCSNYSKTWEYTTIVNGKSGWRSSNLPCTPMSWGANVWHHIQIATHRDSNGIVTYDWVRFDEVLGTFKNAVGNSARALNWAAGDLLINFQLDGASSNSGTMKAFIDGMTVYRW